MKKLTILIFCAVMITGLMTSCRKENAGNTDYSTLGTQDPPETSTASTDTEKAPDTTEKNTYITDTITADTEPPTDSDTDGTEPPSDTTTIAETEPPKGTTDMETSILDKEDSPYFGKIAVAYGDSITHGTFTDVGDNSPDSVVDKKWCDVVSERLGFKYLSNYGQNGISISSTSSVLSGNALSLGYKNLRGDAEVIMIAAGTNDFGTNVKLGNNSDTEDISFCGGLNVLCAGLKEKFPNAKVIFITPIDRRDSASNALGLSLDDYRKKIEEIAGGVYGFEIVDGTCTGFDASDPSFISNYMRDGVHPNQEAHILYGEAVAKALLTVK